MAWEKIHIDGIWIYTPKVFEDERGYFFESYNQSEMPEDIRKINFVQDNESKSTQYVLRGLHYQLPPYSQSKLVRASLGEVIDVVVDIRPNSPTYGETFSIILSQYNKKQMFIPKGFAHGFLVLSEEAIFNYKCDEYYKATHEGGINPEDKNLKLGWSEFGNEFIISDKDKLYPNFGEHKIFE
jgi:dTDP-4-dehydrorhamnose 3,5-epimerase